MAPATLTLEDFGSLTDDEFAFLSNDHSYEPLPAERGGLFGSGFVRRYVRGNCEIGVCFGDADSHHLCVIWFNDELNQDIAKRGYVSRELSTLLAERNAGFVHPTRQDLSTGATPRSVVAQYAKMLKEFASDVIEGDYSPFPTLVYVLHHVDSKLPGGEVRRLLGVYSTYENATGAIEERRSKRGFRKRQEGFELWRVQLDGSGFWYAGIPLDSARQ